MVQADVVGVYCERIKMDKENVLVLGSGIHKDLYYDALVFLDGVRDIRLNEQIDGHEKDIVITEPFSLTEEIISDIEASGFSGTLILEKMVSKSISMLELLQGQTCCSIFVCHRRLYAKKLPLRQDALNEIWWPNRYETNMNPIWHTLPNIIDSLYLAFDNVFPRLIDIYQQESIIAVSFEIDGNITKIHIYPGSEGDKVIVNKQMCDWPNAFEITQTAWNEAHRHDARDTIAYTKQVHEILLQANSLEKRLLEGRT